MTANRKWAWVESVDHQVAELPHFTSDRMVWCGKERSNELLKAVTGGFLWLEGACQTFDSG
jgi:hypothetical protein